VSKRRPLPPCSGGQNASLASDINFCAENPLGAGVTNGFYLLLENTALPHPPVHTSPVPPSCTAQPRERGTESWPEAPSVSASIHVGPRRLHLLRRAADLMSRWKEMSGLPPSSLSAIIGLLGSWGCICVCCLSGLVCTNWKAVTGS
jgi:hypothetical protein